jgi:GNAT superfamily N-acetyltransferase
MRVRKAQPKDLPALTRIVRSSWHPDFVGAADFWLKEETRETKANHIRKRIYPPFRAYVAVEGKDVMAFATAQNYRGRFWIGDVFVDKKSQNKGVGTFLVKKIMEGKKEAYIEVNNANKNAVKFWRDLGFKPVLTESLMVKK